MGVDIKRLGMLQQALPLTVAADIDRAAAGLAGRVHLGGGKLDRPARHGDFAALTGGIAGIERARNRHFAVAAGERDIAALAGNAVGLDRARHVDRLPRHILGCSGGELHRAASGRNLAAVVDQRPTAARLGRYRHLQEAVAGQIKRCLFAGSQGCLTHRHGDDTGIGDRATDQRHVAAAIDGDRTGVRHRGRGAITSKAPLGAHEVVIGDAECRGDEGACLDRA